MSNRKLTESFETGSRILPLEQWPEVDPSLLKSGSKDADLKREKGIIDYVTGKRSVREIQAEYCIDKTEIYRLFRRCMEMAPDGQIYGFRALVPYLRIKPYERKIEGSRGYAGKLTQLFSKQPELEKRVVTKYLGKRRKNHIPEPQIKYKHLHKYFIDECKKMGIGQGEYPFTELNQGKSALRRYLKKLVDKEMRQVVHARHGEENARNIDDTLIEGELHPSRPYASVEMDGHKIDLNMVVWIPTPDGSEEAVLMERIWVLLMEDEGSRSTLGYHISFLRNYSNEDVLQCVMNSLVPWEPKELTIPGLEYGEGAGLPSGLIPECRWRLFDRLRFDNAMSHLSPMVQQRINRVVKCVINNGESKKPKRRALVERLFQTLEENGFHRIASTTGSNVTDTRRRNPEKWAKKYHISLEHLEEIIDVVIAQYNDTPHAGLYGRTPLGYLRYDADNPLSLKRYLPEDQRDFFELFKITVPATIRGVTEKGRRPYVQYQNVPYRNPTISSTPTLVGTKLTLHVNINDLRTIKAYLPNGTSVGLLKADGVWGIRRHTLRIRKTIFKLIREGKLHLSKDPIKAYNEMLARNAITERKSANQYVHSVSVTGKDKTFQDDLDAEEQVSEWRPRKKGWISFTKTSIR